MTKEEALEALNDRTRELDRAEGLRLSAILDALLAGASQRQVAQRARLSVNTVRGIMQDAGIRYVGTRYAAVEAETAARMMDLASEEVRDAG